MTQQFNRMPEYNVPLTEKGNIHKSYYRLFSGLLTGQPTGSPAAVPLTSSPMSWQAPAGGTLIIQGGTVTMVSLTRDGIANYNIGQIQGAFPVSQRDTLIITYTGTPTLTFVPR